MLQKGDTLAFSGNSLVSWIIKLFTKGKYSHVAVVVDNNNCMEALKEGVVITPISEILKRKDKIWHFPLNKYYRYKFNESKFDQFCWQVKGKKYDFVNALKSVLSNEITVLNGDRLTDKNFCSMLDIKSKQHGCIIPRHLDASDFSPAEFLKKFNYIFDKPIRLK